MGDKPHGYGTYTWSANHWQKGNWYEGKMHGTGMIHFEDDSFYDGEWKYGMYEG